MPNDYDSFIARMLAAVENAMQIVGEESVDFGKELIGEPVKRLAAGIVIRSEPGKPPFRDTGDLQANLQQTVDKIGRDKVQLSVSSSRDENPEVPMILEQGDAHVLPRPYMWGVAGGGGPQENTIGEFSVKRTPAAVNAALEEMS